LLRPKPQNGALRPVIETRSGTQRDGMKKRMPALDENNLELFIISVK
jgi:hypothetical protein